jgi:hypothetical protein
MLVVQEKLIQCRFMNILIENAESLEYFTGEGQWTKNVKEGKSYEATEAAYKAAKKEPIGKFNIVFYISQTKQFVNMDHGRGKGSPALAESGNDTAVMPDGAQAS